MSRRVDLSKPLSDEDKKYLISRGKRHFVIANERQFGSQEEETNQEPEGSGAVTTEGERETGQPPEGSLSEEDREWVNNLTVDELKAELETRELSKSGNKDDLRARLIAALSDEDNGGDQ